MGRHDLAARLDRAERRLAPADAVQVWLPIDDERDNRVRNVTTGETLAPAEVGRQAGWHILVRYVDGEDWRARRG